MVGVQWVKNLSFHQYIFFKNKLDSFNSIFLRNKDFTHRIFTNKDFLKIDYRSFNNWLYSEHNIYDN